MHIINTVIISIIIIIIMIINIINSRQAATLTLTRLLAEGVAKEKVFPLLFFGGLLATVFA